MAHYVRIWINTLMSILIAILITDLFQYSHEILEYHPLFLAIKMYGICKTIKSTLVLSYTKTKLCRNMSKSIFVMENVQTLSFWWNMDLQ